MKAKPLNLLILSLQNNTKNMKYLSLTILKENKLKSISFMFLCIFLAASCSQKNKVEENNVATIQKYIDAVEAMDYGTMESLLDDNYVGYGPSYGDSINKEQAVIGWKKSVETLYESIDYNKSRIIAVSVPDGENKGDWVSNWAELHIKYKEDSGDITVWANSVYKIENGKIVKSITFYNEADVLEQLGYVFINPDDL